MIEELEKKYRELEAEMLALPAYRVGKRTLLILKMKETYRKIKIENHKLTEA